MEIFFFSKLDIFFNFRRPLAWKVVDIKLKFLREITFINLIIRKIDCYLIEIVCFPRNLLKFTVKIDITVFDFNLHQNNATEHE